MNHHRDSFRSIVDHYAAHYGRAFRPEHVQLSDSEITLWLEAEAEPELLCLQHAEDWETALIRQSIKAHNSSGVMQAVLRGIAKRLATDEIVADVPSIVEQMDFDRHSEEMHG